MKIYKLVFLLCVIIVMVGGAFVKLSDYRLLSAPMYYSGKMHFLPDVELLINCDSGVEGIDSFISEIILSSKDESSDVWSQVILDSDIDQSVLKKRRGFFSKINSVDIFCTYKRGGAVLFTGNSALWRE